MLFLIIQVLRTRMRKVQHDSWDRHNLSFFFFKLCYLNVFLSLSSTCPLTFAVSLVEHYTRTQFCKDLCVHCSVEHRKAVPPAPVELRTWSKICLIVMSRYDLEQLHFLVHKPNLAAASWYRISHNRYRYHSILTLMHVTA